jgi:hypothetical protein
MSRHATLTLDPATAERATRARLALMTAVSNGQPVAFTYENRETHVVTERSGDVVAFNGGAPGMSNESVLIECNGIPKTFNVWLIRSIQVLGG